MITPPNEKGFSLGRPGIKSIHLNFR